MTREEYDKRYMEDVNANRPAELIVLEVLNNLNNGYTYEDVAKIEKYYCKGDILMKKDGKKTKKIDAKNDGEVADTGNFAVEAGGYSKIYGYRKKGWIDSQYDYVSVISQQAKTIWILSFKRLKEVYKDTALTEGRLVTSEFWDNVKYNYLIPVYKAIELGVVLAKITYEYDDWTEEYIPVEYKNKEQLQSDIV